MGKQRYFIELAYHGAQYHGWQLQKGAVTVQAVINEALQRILRDERINVVGCGRTDAGVHAREFYAHFDTKASITRELDLPFKLNNYLPRDIGIRGIFQVDKNAHARYDAVSRTYEYRITLRKDPFEHELAYYLHGHLDVGLMNKGAALLLAYENFKSFSKVNTQVKTFLCDVTRADWEEKDNLLVFTITANRFLRNMVRAIVGTLIELGQHKIDIQGFTDIIESGKRSKAGYSVPAKGLFLTRVCYPEELLGEYL